MHTAHKNNQLYENFTQKTKANFPYYFIYYVPLHLKDIIRKRARKKKLGLHTTTTTHPPHHTSSYVCVCYTRNVHAQNFFSRLHPNVYNNHHSLCVCFTYMYLWVYGTWTYVCAWVVYLVTCRFQIVRRSGPHWEKQIADWKFFHRAAKRWKLRDKDWEKVREWKGKRRKRQYIYNGGEGGGGVVGRREVWRKKEFISFRPTQRKIILKITIIFLWEIFSAYAPHTHVAMHICEYVCGEEKSSSWI